jgi:hypothetical protein
MKYLESFEDKNTNFIDINDIILDEELVLVDTNNIDEIIKLNKEGKMPLDKLRVETMYKKIKENKYLPPIILFRNNKLKDGHHRYAAYDMANVRKIPFKYYNN